MTGSLRHISVEKREDVCIVRIRDHRMLEADMIEMADEVVGLIEDRGCRKLVLCLGPGEVVCLYSVFLAKLVMIRRHVLEKGGVLRIAEANENTLNVFRACDLDKLLSFVPNVDTALAELTKIAIS
ncbi:MAG TPA: hypothetical protein VGP68_11395 [Gemmataceae bacterium]|jgi:hypothetical protein|nr:hypothetical protein [Gemmataceae bacterium]